MAHRLSRPFLALLFACALMVPGTARAGAVSAVGDLASLGARPAAMGGWHGVGLFGAQGVLSTLPPADFQRTRFTHTHSLRHFPHGRKNLDQLDADPVSVLVPLNQGNSLVGLTFSLSGELGMDHRDTNGALSKKHWLRGKVREAFYAAVADEVANAYSLQWRNTWEQWDDGPVVPRRAVYPGAHMMAMGSGRWRWSVGLRRQMPVEGQDVKAAWLWSLGGAYLGNHRVMAAASLIGEGLHLRRHSLGVEKSSGPNLKLRTGYGEDWTYGWGWKAGSFLLDYAVMKNVAPSLSAQPFPRFKDAHLLTYGFVF